jgi:hypothetical protein
MTREGEGRGGGRQGKPLQVWLDEETMGALQELADANGRALAAEARHAILRHLASPPQLMTPGLADVPAGAAKRTPGRKARGG